MIPKTQATAPAAPPRPARAGLRRSHATILPAMPESPIPDLAPRNRTPDPTSRPALPKPVER